MTSLCTILAIRKPMQIPWMVEISCPESIEAVASCSEFEKDDHWHFIIGVIYPDSPVVKKRLNFSYEKAPSLNYSYSPVGEINPGEIFKEKRRIYIFLENLSKHEW